MHLCCDFEEIDQSSGDKNMNKYIDLHTMKKYYFFGVAICKKAEAEVEAIRRAKIRHKVIKKNAKG